jgi:hypothetical protein
VNLAVVDPRDNHRRNDGREGESQIDHEQIGPVGEGHDTNELDGEHDEQDECSDNGNDDSTEPLEYGSEYSSDLDPSHPDYAFLRRAKLCAQKSEAIFLN